MSNEIIAPALTVLILAGLFLWVPTLHVCSGCRQSLLRRRSDRSLAEADRMPEGSEVERTV